MPAFILKNGRCFISYITGPSHVLLGLSFGPENSAPLMVRVPQATHGSHGPLDESRIREAVIKGVAAAGVPQHLVEIVYCEGDSPRYELYQHCACVLAKRIASGGEFIESPVNSTTSTSVDLPAPP